MAVELGSNSMLLSNVLQGGGPSQSHHQSSPLMKTISGSRQRFLEISRHSCRQRPRFHHRRVMTQATATAPAEKIQNKVDESEHFFKTQRLDEGGSQEWHPATVIAAQELAPGVKSVIVEAECSREMVALEDAYSAPGRVAQLRVNGKDVFKVAAASPPFSMKVNEAVLYKLRGDIPAGMTKQPQFFLSVKAPLELLVFQSESPKLYALKEGDQVEVGPFDLSGLDLRPILFLSAFPTVLFFASGKGIAVAKSIIEAKDADVGSLSLGMREDVRLFYWASDPSKVLYKDNFSKWETEKLKVRAAVGKTRGLEWDAHVGSFQSLWDEDDIEYDPESTAVVVCVDADMRGKVNHLLSDAGIPEKQILKWEP